MDTIEVIELAKLSIENKLTSWINIDEYGYLLQDLITDNNYLYRIVSNDFQWKQSSEILKRNDWWTYFVTYTLNFDGIVIIQQDNIITNKPKKFELFIDLWFKTDEILFSYRILDKSYKTIKDYIEHIESYNEENGIYSLIDKQVQFGNKNFLSFATDITRKPRQLKVTFNDIDIIDDIARISQDLKYLLGEIFQLKPYLSNYVSNPQNINDKVHYVYFSSFIDKRYFFLTGVIFEILYNFWDRIGDLLAIYFTPNLKSDKILFTTVIDGINAPYLKSQNYSWLKNFRDIQYKSLNSYRKQVVHYKNIESRFHDNYTTAFSNKLELEKLQREKIEMMDLVDEHLKFTILGCEKTFSLIDEIV